VILVVAADKALCPKRANNCDPDLYSAAVWSPRQNRFDRRLRLAGFSVKRCPHVLVGTTLESSYIFRVSNKTNQGVGELVAGLEKLLGERPLHPDLGKPRLPVDRVFTIAGFGTVVTGTLQSGSFKVGDEVEILPSGERGEFGVANHQGRLSGLSRKSHGNHISVVDVNQITARGGGKALNLKIYTPVDVSIRLLSRQPAD
jgi:selenocysteine-specific elongation factor